MAHRDRHKTDYPGVIFHLIPSKKHAGKMDRSYFIRYRKDGKLKEEKVGLSSAGMTPQKASRIKGRREIGIEPTNAERREKEKAEVAPVWTFSRLYEKYNETVQRKDRRNDDCRFHLYIKASIGSKCPEDILPLDLDRIRLKKLKGKSPATVRNTLELIRRISNFGRKKQLSSGLSFRVQMPTVDNEKTEFLTQDQVAALLKACDESNNQTAASMLRLVLFSGLRRGEIFKLRWEHVDFENRQIRLVDPKGKKSVSIPMNDLAFGVLHSQPRSDSPYIFPGKNGSQRVDAVKSCNAIKRSAGLPSDFRIFHGLRHHFASSLASSGVDLYHLQKLLTHKSPAMTARYSHLSDDVLMSDSNKIADSIKK
jgi:integrase